LDWIAGDCRSFGLEPGDRVMLVSENRPEWLISDLAIMASGCITVPAYVTNTERDHQHILDDSGLVVPGIKGLEKDPLLGIEDVNFMVAGFIFIIFINVLVKLWLDKRQERE